MRIASSEKPMISLLKAADHLASSSNSSNNNKKVARPSEQVSRSLSLEIFQVLHDPQRSMFRFFLRALSLSLAVFNHRTCSFTSFNKKYRP